MRTFVHARGICGRGLTEKRLGKKDVCEQAKERIPVWCLAARLADMVCEIPGAVGKKSTAEQCPRAEGEAGERTAHEAGPDHEFRCPPSRIIGAERHRRIRAGDECELYGRDVDTLVRTQRSR
jgi:hypothetical protein